MSNKPFSSAPTVSREFSGEIISPFQQIDVEVKAMNNHHQSAIDELIRDYSSQEQKLNIRRASTMDISDDSNNVNQLANVNRARRSSILRIANSTVLGIRRGSLVEASIPGEALANDEQSASNPDGDIKAVSLVHRASTVLTGSGPGRRGSAYDISKNSENIGGSNLEDSKSGQNTDTENIELSNITSKPNDRGSVESITPQNTPAVMAFSHLSVKTIPRRGNVAKALLDDVSGFVTGGFWAIMGPSGGGKTTLLNTLSLRYNPQQISVSGKRTLNGRLYNKNDLKIMSGYVMQDDLLRAELTVGETLWFHAQLSLAPDLTAEEIEERFMAVLELMGIMHVIGVYIGDTVNKGISGGERKRVCIAMALLRDPCLLFCDEPTSGLDSSTALKVCSSLKKLTSLGKCTTLCTIHQPQDKIFQLFDNLILMRAGKIVYMGATDKVIPYLEGHGIPCPPEVNPADHIINCLQISPGGKNSFQEIESEVKTEIDMAMGANLSFESEWVIRPWYDHVVTLSRRNILQNFRNWRNIIINLVCVTIIAIFVSFGAWYQMGVTQESIKIREPSIWNICVSQGVVASLQSVWAFPLERALLLRERASGTYKTSSYLIARTISDSIMYTIAPIIFCIIAYPVMGYQPGVSKFFIYTFFMIFDTMAATSLAVLVSCVCVSLDLTTIVLSMLFEITRLYGGFFIKPSQMVDYPEWKFAFESSFLKYVYVGACVNELTGLDLTCTSSQVQSGKCVETGEELMAYQGYDDYSIGYCFGILIVYIMACRFLSYVALRYIKG